MPKHIMLDLETWSTAANATVISIGAVAFDPFHHGIADAFHVGIDPKLLGPAAAALFHIDPSTVGWWMDADRADARAAWLAMDKLDLPTALFGFADWYAAQLASEALPADQGLPVWGNGAAFDNVILRRSYELLNMECPWKFWDDRCYRTLKGVSSTRRPKVNFADHGGVAHTALADATTQALHLQEMVLDDDFFPRSDRPVPRALNVGTKLSGSMTTAAIHDELAHYAGTSDAGQLARAQELEAVLRMRGQA